MAYPTSIDSFPSATTLAANNLNTDPHSTLHGAIGNALAALEAKLGVDSSAVVTSIDYKINHLSGDVTGTVTSVTIAAGAVTLPKMANLAANAFIGNNTASPATPMALTTTQAKALLAIANTDVSGLGTMSTVASPAPVANGGTAATTAINARTNLSAAQLLVPTAVKSTTYVAASGDFVPCDTTSAGFTVTLPTAPADGTTIAVALVKQSSTNAVTIAAGGSDVFDVAAGTTTATASLLFQTETFQYKASSAIWYRTSSRLPRTQLYASFSGDATVNSSGVVTLAGSANVESIIRANTLDQLTAAAANVNLNSNRLINVANAVTGTDALNQTTADGRYIAAGSGATINRQVFNASGTWTKPANALLCWGLLIGPGGGGASGRRGAASSARGGGGGGGAGGVVSLLFRPADLSATETVTIGTGGGGGGAQTTNDTNGIGGSSGSGNSSFGTRAVAGNAGPLGNSGGGTTSAGTNGNGTVATARPGAIFAGTFLTAVQGGPGGLGAGATAGTAGTAGVGSGGGGGGGGLSAANARDDGANGGVSGDNTTGGVGGVGAGVNGAAPTAPTLDFQLGAGGGGGAAGTTTGGNGAAGTRGGGGGGGGASVNGNNSGAGGAGGDGYCVIYTLVSG